MTEALSPSTTEETKFLQNFTRKKDENQPSHNHPLSAAHSSPSVTTNTSPLDIQLESHRIYTFTYDTKCTSYLL